MGSTSCEDATIYVSRIGEKDTCLILSQNKAKKMDTTNNAGQSPSQERPLKRSRESDKECAKCHSDPGETYIICNLCNLKFCQQCCRLPVFILKAYAKDPQDLEGMDWKCSPCSVTANSFKSIDQKLDNMEKNSKERMETMEKKLVGIEERITNKVIAEIPAMIKTEIDKMEVKVNETLKKNVEEVETKLTAKVTEEVKTVSDKLDKAQKDMVPKEEVSKMIEEALEKSKAEMKALPKSPSSSSAPKSQVSPGTLLRSAVAEMKEREKRENRIVIYKLEEPATNLRAERIENDKGKLMEIAANTLAIKNLKNSEIIRADRLGEKKDNSPRPLLIEFNTAERAHLIISKASRLRDSDYKHISLTYDMTPKEREQQKKLVGEAKKKQQSEGGRWIYKVRGPPWAMRIIKIEGKKPGKETETPGTSMDEDKE